MRNFGSNREEIQINAMKPNEDKTSDLLALRELNSIFERISSYVITVLPKCEEGIEVLNHILPWIQKYSNYRTILWFEKSSI